MRPKQYPAETSLITCAKVKKGNSKKITVVECTNCSVAIHCKLYKIYKIKCMFRAHSVCKASVSIFRLMFVFYLFEFLVNY